jgi:hypothetical protein
LLFVGLQLEDRRSRHGSTDRADLIVHDLGRPECTTPPSLAKGSVIVGEAATKARVALSREMRMLFLREAARHIM